jgi:phage terminase large subunit-like protein
MMTGRSLSNVVEFIQQLRHFKGKWAGRRFQLLDWQSSLIEDVFNTLDVNGNRQYRTVFVEVPRKNGKTTLAAAIALYLLFADGESAAEVYGAAHDRDQAGLVFGAAAGMVRESGLSDRLKVIDSTKRITYELRNSFYRAIPSDAAGAFGFNASGILFDEFHTQRNRELYDALVTSTGAREQPLTFIITTAGYDVNSVCYELHDYALKVGSGVIEDPTFYPVIYAADEEDDWTDPEVWKKANPSLGVTITEEFLKAECERATQVPAFQNTFRRLYLNQWTSQEERWLDIRAWDDSSGMVRPEELEGRKCYAGLDLASTTDIAALCLVFGVDEHYEVLPFFFIPKEGMLERSRRDKVPYEKWAREGLINTTPGNVIDYGFIREKIKELNTRYNVREIAYDRWGAVQLSQDLEGEGFTVVPFGQGFASMSPPTKELLTLVLGKKLVHGGNPVLRWMADNMVVKQDPAGNVKPDKAKSTQRIDGMVALIMALDRATRHEGKDVNEAYKTRGLITI